MVGGFRLWISGWAPTRKGAQVTVRRRVSAAVAFSCVVAGLVIVPGSLHTPTAADPPTGGTSIVSETFTGGSVADPAWTVQNHACLTGATTAPPAGAAQIPTCAAHRVGDVPPLGATPGYLQLTDESANAVGSVLYNRPVPATAGVSITLDQYQYGGTGADGIGFFLVDGSTNLTEAGAPGGSLGYAQRNAEPGIRGGVLGVGLDAYGNFYDDGEGRGAGCPAGQRSPSTASGPVAPNVITLRGPGSGTTGYCYLASTTPPVPPANPNKPGTTLNGGTGTLRASTLAASWRQVNIQVTPAPSPRVIVQVRYRPGVTGDPWITELDVPAPAGLPRTYKFGLSASTGGSNDVHLIRNALVQSINPLSNLQLEKQVDRTAGNLPPVITAGTVIPYQYTVTNAGLETLTDLAIADDKITGPITCDRTSLLVAPAPGSTTVCRGTYTVTAADVQAGQVTNTATAAALDPGADTVTSPPSSVAVPLTWSSPSPTRADPASLHNRTGGAVRLHGHQHGWIDALQRRRHRRPRPVRHPGVPSQRPGPRPRAQKSTIAPAPSTSPTPTLRGQDHQHCARERHHTDRPVRPIPAGPSLDRGQHRHRRHRGHQQWDRRHQRRGDLHVAGDQQRTRGRHQRRHHRPAPRRPPHVASLQHIPAPHRRPTRPAPAPSLPSLPSPWATRSPSS